MVQQQSFDRFVFRFFTKNELRRRCTMIYIFACHSHDGDVNIEDNQNISARSELDIRYIKLPINGVTGYLALQFIATFHSVDDFFIFILDTRECARESAFHRNVKVTRSCNIEAACR